MLNIIGSVFFIIGSLCLIAAQVTKQKDTQVQVGSIVLTDHYSLEDIKNLDIYVSDDEIVVSDKNGRRLETWKKHNELLR